MQPTGGGRLHLGNLEGALRPWVGLQDQYEMFCFIADWHSLTTVAEKQFDIAEASRQTAMDFLAAGLDPQKCAIFRQSDVKEHAELHLLLSMVTPVGWLERVPTFKEKRTWSRRTTCKSPTAFSATRSCRRRTSSSTAPTWSPSARTRPRTWKSAARSPAASTASSARTCFPNPRHSSAT